MTPDDIRTALRVVPVDMLPPPRHLRYPCAFERDHVRLVETLGDERLAFERFLAELGPRVRECEYHQVDWPLVVESAITAHEAAPDAQGLELATAADRIATARGADGHTLDWLAYLLCDPIEVIDEGRFLQDGQRRVCALTATGIKRCPVRVDLRP